jgi:ribosomal protein S27AE
MTSPNSEYRALDLAYAFFNTTLFGGILPGALITLHDHPRARGYFRRKAFAHRADAEAYTDEICLCPGTHAGRTDHDILSTLVHEQVHLWQFHFGTPPRRCYHDREWADKMIEIGLMPSATGEPGGKQTGQSMTHYIVVGGPFDVACTDLLATGWALQWEQPSRQVASAGGAKGAGGEYPKATRRKFACPKCKLSAQAKPTARLICGECQVEMG